MRESKGVDWGKIERDLNNQDKTKREVTVSNPAPPIEKKDLNLSKELGPITGSTY